jgi:pyridoxal 5'-phosphate synthase pdxS subunit
LMMQLGAEAVFVGSGIFKSSDPAARAQAMVKAVTHYKDPATLVEISMSLGEAMEGLEMEKIAEEDRLANRGI